ncbi:uncharacterized protein LOC111814572 [Octodon degus]|uniref:Uncharacterized protein LOC111814572 n=1 Tax=Octodon degus TaxID=10160 RepID=A0A6P6DWU0_OCTDE|nr:uncharacterized protein LOC111814572 [Octodon degus]
MEGVDFLSFWKGEAARLPEPAPRGAAAFRQQGPGVAEEWRSPRRLLAPLPSHWTVRAGAVGPPLSGSVSASLRSAFLLPFSSSSSNAAGARVPILPPPPSSASSPQGGRRPLQEPKHKHSSPGAAATSAARRRPAATSPHAASYVLSSLPVDRGLFFLGWMDRRRASRIQEARQRPNGCPELEAILGSEGVPARLYFTARPCVKNTIRITPLCLYCESYILKSTCRLFPYFTVLTSPK